jgi:hypothetical protein
MTAAILTKKQTQAQRILNYIRSNPGCGNRELFLFSNSPWSRIYEYTFSSGGIRVMPDGRETMVPKEMVERRYVMRNGRRHVTYYVRKIK